MGTEHADLIARLACEPDEGAAGHELSIAFLRALGYEVAKHKRGWRQRRVGGLWEAMERPADDHTDAMRVYLRLFPEWSLTLHVRSLRCAANGSGWDSCRMKHGTICTSEHLGPSPQRAMCMAMLEAAGGITIEVEASC